MRDRYASLREGLVGAWIPSVSGSGLLLPDLSGNGNNGTLTNMGPEDWVSSQYGRALDFDGVNDYSSALLDLSQHSAIAISLWFRYFSHINSGRVILEFTTNYNNTNGAFGLFADEPRGSGGYSVFVRTGAGAFDYVGGWFSKPSVNTWHNWVVNFRKSQTIASGGCEVFIDGRKQTFFETIDTPDASNFTNSVLYIASRAGSSLFAPAQLDDIRIYNRALSEPEIKLLASRPGIGLRPQRRTMYYAPPTGARRRRILTSMP